MKLVILGPPKFTTVRFVRTKDPFFSPDRTRGPPRRNPPCLFSDGIDSTNRILPVLDPMDPPFLCTARLLLSCSIQPSPLFFVLPSFPNFYRPFCTDHVAPPLLSRTLLISRSSSFYDQPLSVRTLSSSYRVVLVVQFRGSAYWHPNPGLI